MLTPSEDHFPRLKWIFPILSPLAAEVQRPAAHWGADARAQPQWHDEGAFRAGRVQGVTTRRCC